MSSMHVHMKIDIKIKPRSLVYDQAIYGNISLMGLGKTCHDALQCLIE